MLRKIGFTLLSVSCLFTTNVFSTGYHTFAPGMSVEYELPINEPQIFSNIFFWKLRATCTILTETNSTPTNPLSVTMLRKTGSVNDIILYTGDKIGLSVQQGDKMGITADSGAKVELINLGKNIVRASCSSS